jgi:hypothetical protein
MFGTVNTGRSAFAHGIAGTTLGTPGAADPFALDFTEPAGYPHFRAAMSVGPTDGTLEFQAYFESGEPPTAVLGDARITTGVDSVALPPSVCSSSPRCGHKPTASSREIGWLGSSLLHDPGVLVPATHRTPRRPRRPAICASGPVGQFRIRGWRLVTASLPATQQIVDAGIAAHVQLECCPSRHSGSSRYERTALKCSATEIFCSVAIGTPTATFRSDLRRRPIPADPPLECRHLRWRDDL